MIRTPMLPWSAANATNWTAYEQRFSRSSLWSLICKASGRHVTGSVFITSTCWSVTPMGLVQTQLRSPLRVGGFWEQPVEQLAIRQSKIGRMGLVHFLHHFVYLLDMRCHRIV